MDCNEKSLLSLYDDALCAVCRNMSDLSKFKEKSENGEVFKKKDFDSLYKKIEHSKNVLLEVKEKLGYTDRFAFLEDNTFLIREKVEGQRPKIYSFSIENGILKGNREDIIHYAIEKRHHSENNYEYEVSRYLMALYFYGGNAND